MVTILARKDEYGRTQTLQEHSLSVGDKCETYGNLIGLGKIMKVTGLVHDYGKLNPKWQKYLMVDSQNEKMDHATWGAKFLCERYYFSNHPNSIYQICRKFIVESIANAICGHHSQLSDGLNLDGESPFIKRLMKEEIQPLTLIPLFEKEIMSLHLFDELVHEATLEYVNLFTRISTNSTEKGINKKIACFSPLFAHHIYSVLVDADRTDAREWQEGLTPKLPSLIEEPFIKQLKGTLNDYVDDLNRHAAPNKINRLRQAISVECEQSGKLPTGVYRLATPVGAGKTVSSLRFAIEHAKIHKKERIIYVLPFTAIIEQNAEEVRDILKGKDWLLEHHGQVIFEEDPANPRFSLSVAKDNWDSPIIFTTFYQYLSTFYGGVGRNLRRLHHLTNSIVIFDEVQSVPPNSISLFNESINYLNEVGNTTVLLCTATQPTLNQVTHYIRSEIPPIVKDESTLANAFKRVDIQSVKKLMNTPKLTEFIKGKMTEFDSILVILNTKDVVKSLYESLQYEKLGIPIYHLSTNMCPKHRTKILNQVKEHLKKKEKVICIATALIEAGVNISFQSVIRSIAGLDSIAQASGRCNRHGELAMGKMFLINHIEENLMKLPTIKKGKEVTSDMLTLLHIGKHAWNGELIGPEAINFYYNLYFEKIKIDMNYPIQTKDGRRIYLYSLLFRNSGKRAAYCPPIIENPPIKPSSFIQHLQQPHYPLYIDSAYRTVFEYYQVYDGEQVSVVVPYELGTTWIQQIESGIFPVNWQKEIQSYTINFYKDKVDKLIAAGIIKEIEIKKDQFVYVLKPTAYDPNYGYIKE